MYQGKDERGGGGARWAATAATLVIALAVLGVAVWSLLRDDGSVRDRRDDAPQFSFDLAAVRGLGVTGSAGRAELRQPARHIRATLDSLYAAAFVDPARWEGGRFPEVLAAFAGPAQRGARRDLADLTLGPAVKAIESVRPAPSEVSLRFLLHDGEPIAAVARTSFHATARLRQGGRLDVVHEGRFVLRRSGRRWVIVGYEVDGRMEPARAPTRGEGGAGG